MAHTQDMAIVEISDKTGLTTVKEDLVEEIVEEEISPENIPLPTDSMITVRLSDAQLLAEPDTFETSLDQHTPEGPEPDTTTSITSPGSRSSSRASSQSSRVSQTSNSNSNSVDWEGLERTEEQEVKDDATDEVRQRRHCLDTQLICIVYGASARQT